MAFIWTQNMSVGIRQFDDDHKKLIRYANELQYAIQDARDKGTLDPVEIEVILHRMENYARWHFRSEEAAMEKTGYPELEVHRGEHRKFIAKVAEMTKRFMGSSNPQHAAEIAEFLYNWIVDHVYRIDGEYVDHLHDHAMEWCRPTEITGTIRQAAKVENNKGQSPRS